WIRGAMQCAMYATKLGVLEGYSRDDLTALCYGALLHDIGILSLPDAIMMKSGPLTRDELEIMKTHTTIGYKMLKDDPAIPLVSAHCALSHHERSSGNGYPFGVRGPRSIPTHAGLA